MIISFEDIINAQTDSTDLEDRLRSVWEAEPLKQLKNREFEERSPS